jgi:RimJ/RimL family protein N-acetyltransferase
MLPIATERLILRPFRLGDLDQFVAYRRKPEVAIYQNWSDYSEEDAQMFYDQQRALAFNTDNTWYQVAIILMHDESLVGDLGLHFIDAGRQVEIGFTLDSYYQQQGYAVEAMSAALDLLFKTLNKHRVLAVCDAKNLAAQKLLDKLKFRQEAAYIKNIFFKGEWGDEHSYAMLQHEWNG